MGYCVTVRVKVEGYDLASEGSVVSAVCEVLRSDAIEQDFTPVIARNGPQGTRRITTRTKTDVIAPRPSLWAEYLQDKFESVTAEANGGAPCRVTVDMQHVVSEEEKQQARDEQARRKALGVPGASVKVQVDGKLGFDSVEHLDEAVELVSRAIGEALEVDRAQLELSGSWKFSGPKPKLDMQPMHWLRDLALAARTARTGQLFVQLPRKIRLAVHPGGYVSVVHSSDQPVSTLRELEYRSLSHLQAQGRQRATAEVDDVVFSPDGTRCAVEVAYRDKERQLVKDIPRCVVLADARTGSQLDRLYEDIGRMEFSTDGRVLAMTSHPHLLAWNLESGRVERREVDEWPNVLLRALPEGRWLVAGKHFLRVRGPSLDVLHSIEVPGGELTNVLVSADGRRIATLTKNYQFACWGLDGTHPLLELPGRAIAMAAGTSLFVVVQEAPDQTLINDRYGRELPPEDAAYKKVLRAIDLHTLDTLWSVPITGNPRELIFSPDGEEILGACVEQRHVLARRWSASDGSKLKGVGGDPTGVSDCVWNLECTDGRVTCECAEGRVSQARKLVLHRWGA